MTLLDIATACNLHRDAHGDWVPQTPTHNTYSATYNHIDNVWEVTPTQGDDITTFASEYDALFHILRLMNVHLNLDIPSPEIHKDDNPKPWVPHTTESMAATMGLTKDDHGEWLDSTGLAIVYPSPPYWFCHGDAGNIAVHFSEADAMAHRYSLFLDMKTARKHQRHNGPPTVDEVLAALTAWRKVPAHDIARVDNTTAEYFGVLLAKAYLDTEIAKR